MAYLRRVNPLGVVANDVLPAVVVLEHTARLHP
jgi:hypothetical protein